MQIPADLVGFLCCSNCGVAVYGQVIKNTSPTLIWKCPVCRATNNDSELTQPTPQGGLPVF